MKLKTIGAAIVLVAVAGCSSSSSSDAPPVQLVVGSRWVGTWGAHVAELTVSTQTGSSVAGTLTISQQGLSWTGTAYGTRILGATFGTGVEIHRFDVTVNTAAAEWRMAGTWTVPAGPPRGSWQAGQSGLVDLDRLSVPPSPLIVQRWRISRPVPEVVLIERTP